MSKGKNGTKAVKLAADTLAEHGINVVTPPACDFLANGKRVEVASATLVSHKGWNRWQLNPGIRRTAAGERVLAKRPVDFHVWVLYKKGARTTVLIVPADAAPKGLVYISESTLKSQWSRYVGAWELLK